MIDTECQMGQEMIFVSLPNSASSVNRHGENLESAKSSPCRIPVHTPRTDGCWEHFQFRADSRYFVDDSWHFLGELR